MSLRLAAQLSRRIAAVASVGGVMTTISAAAYSATRNVPVMLIHGTDDLTVPFNGGSAGWYTVDQTMNFWIQRNSYALTAETLIVPNRSLTDNSTVEVYTHKFQDTSWVKLYKVVGGTHEWPGAPPYPGVGVINYDIDANAEIWNFFKQGKSMAVEIIGTTMPDKFQLQQNYPNPFNPSTTIRFSVPVKSKVRLQIFNLLGQQVAELANEEVNAGYFQKMWTAGVASGLYFYRLEAVSTEDLNKSFVQVRKMLMVR